MKRINDKISEIEHYLNEFSEFLPNDFEDYKKNIVLKAACERYVEKIVESITDLAFLLIKFKHLKLPEDDINAFRILYENKIINEKLYSNLKNAKGMRNILVHQYGLVDDEIIFNSFNQLIDDSNDFIQLIPKLI
ncbi:MAG: type VII toxin-antitoxin system HepT family RNase toxin [Candidatus Woesearchaeota archaeon]